jgi:hypothetical protein
MRLLNLFKNYIVHYMFWFRHYVTSWKVAGSSPNEVDTFNLPNPSSRTMALGSTHPLTEMIDW